MREAIDWPCWRDPEHPVTTHPEFGWPMCAVCKAAPQFYERAQYMDPAYTITCYVPLPRPYQFCDPTSGIVGWNTMPGHVQVYYEGFRFGNEYDNASPRERWEAAIRVATDRAVTSYPTVAQAILKSDAVLPIGTYQPFSRTLDVIDDLHLDEWLGIASV